MRLKFTEELVHGILPELPDLLTQPFSGAKHQYFLEDDFIWVMSSMAKPPAWAKAGHLSLENLLLKYEDLTDGI